MNENTLKSVLAKIQENANRTAPKKAAASGKYITIQFPKDSKSESYDGDAISALLFIGNRKAKGSGRHTTDPVVLRMAVGEAVTTYAGIMGWESPKDSVGLVPTNGVAKP